LRIIISIDDADTAVIAGRHAFQIAATFGRALETVAAVDSKLKFCIHCGIPDLVPINVFQIAHSLEMYLCKALPGMHAVPGCDTVSFFNMKGKSTTWKFFKENQVRFTNVLITLRKTLEEILSEDSLSDLEAYICQFYPHKGRVLERANDARESQLKPESKLVSDESFPPQRVCLHQRFLRAQYQAFQWCHASQGHLNLPSPTEFGFEEVDSKLKVNWFDGDMLPRPCIPEFPVVVRLDHCKSRRCGCRKAGLLCNAMRIVNAKVAVIVEIMLQKMEKMMMRKMQANLVLTAVRINKNIDIISYIFLSEQCYMG